MRHNFHQQTVLAAIVCLAMALTMATTTSVRAAEKTNAAAMPGVSDPQKGHGMLGSPQIQQQYQQALARVGKGGEWRGPDKVLPEVVYEGQPVSEVADNLRDRFDQQFDVLLPTGGWGISPDGERMDTSSTPVNLRLKNVTASEVFNAINLYFEASYIPLRWELMMNGRRPTVLLRVLQDPMRPAELPPQEIKRAIFYVGDLIGDTPSAGMSMAQILKTLSDVTFADSKRQVPIQCHESTEMLVVKGTQVEIDLVRDTLVALNQKAKMDARRKQMEAIRRDVGNMEAAKKAKSNTTESKPGPTTPKNP